MFVDRRCAAVPFVSLPWSSAKISPPALSTRSITSSWTFSERTSQSKYATTSWSARPASIISIAANRPGRLDSGSLPLTSISAIGAPASRSPRSSAHRLAASICTSGE
jgi:hypothetical protein